MWKPMMPACVSGVSRSERREKPGEKAHLEPSHVVSIPKQTRATVLQPLPHLQRSRRTLPRQLQILPQLSPLPSLFPSDDTPEILLPPHPELLLFHNGLLLLHRPEDESRVVGSACGGRDGLVQSEEKTAEAGVDLLKEVGDELGERFG